MEEAFSVNTLLYQGARAIARYDGGKTSHLHTLFDFQYYEDVRAHLMRRFDDTRSVFPDTGHSALRLYTAGAPKVFPVITALDIMSIEWTARSNHLDGATPVTASTMAVGR